MNRKRDITVLKPIDLKVLALAITCAVAMCSYARNIYITPDADGTGNGSAWESPMRITDYLVTANVKNGDVVRLKAGSYTAQIAQVTFGNSMNIRISGGYAGTDDTTLNEENPISTIDFANYPSSGAGSPLKCAASSGYSVTLERLCLTRARSTAIYKQNAGTLRLSDCVVVSNGWRNYSSSTSSGGRGIHVENGVFSATNCVIAYNGPYDPDHSGSYGDNGFGIYLDSTAAEIVGCKIYGNGSPITQAATAASTTTIRQGGQGMAIYAKGSTTLKAIDCDFFCNKTPMGKYTSAADTATGAGAGGTVAFYAVTGSGSFSNCSFVANMNVRDHEYGRYNVKYGGALEIYMGTMDKTVNIDNCTFAYNLTDSPGISPCLDVWRGTVNVRNSIFVGNCKPATSSLGSDIHARTGAVVNVSHTIFDAADANDAWHFSTETIGVDSGTLNIGTGVIFGDAMLASATEASTNLIVNTSKKIQNETFQIAYYDPSRIDEVLAFDVHLRSKAGRWTASGYENDRKHSPAIDAGDPSADIGLEPEPNGGRLNLGRYGSTKYASLTYLPRGLVIFIQ